MALPIVKALKDCGDYAKTVEPYLPQLYELPYKVLENIGNPAGLKLLYIQTNPLMSALGVSIFLSVIFLATSEFNKNYSQVDRMWSILPNLYVVHYAVWARIAGAPHTRMDLVAVFTTLWSVRLTYNYWRRGGYEIGSEDYRWAIAKRQVPGFVWFFFNVTFISLFQSVLIFAISGLPAYAILVSTQFDPNITTADSFYFLISVGLLVTEWTSDGQQWNFQNAKYLYKDTGKITEGYKKEDLELGFNTSGLFAYSRHPNFLAEQSIWLCVYQWSCYATNNVYSYTGLGVASLIMVFRASTWLTELITAGKYEAYKDYQSKIGMFFPTSIKPYSRSTSSPPKFVRTSELDKQK